VAQDSIQAGYVCWAASAANRRDPESPTYASWRVPV
jgi:hypothetical protein